MTALVPSDGLPMGRGACLAPNLPSMGDSVLPVVSDLSARLPRSVSMVSFREVWVLQHGSQHSPIHLGVALH
jgi:hypothetical protein